MAAPDYEFYIGAYLGESIPEAEFPRYALRAEEELLAFERAFTVRGDAIQRNKAACAIADAIFAADMLGAAVLPVDENGNLATTRVSVGSVSTSSAAASPAALGMDMSEAGQKKLYYSLLCKYMAVCRGLW